MTGSRLSPSLIQTLPGRLYTDPEVFAQEQARIFESMWFAVARGADLAAPGSYLTKQVGTENVIVIRGRDGGLRAFLNVCRHRGARLCDSGAGQLRRNLQCSYHAWTYGLDGALIAAPNLTKMQDIDRSEYGLIAVQLREWLGYAWVCLADDPPSFEHDVIGAATERLGGADVIGGWQMDQLAVGRRITYDVRANWKLIIENFMECYHCATIHPELTEMLPEFVEGNAAQMFVGHGALFAPDARGFTVDRGEGLEAIPGVDADHDRRYYAITVKPQVFINLVPDHVIFHRMYPLAADRTVVECDWLYLPEVVESQADLSRSVELFDRVNLQDFAACEACQPSMSSRAYAAGGVLVPSEHHLGEFHAWLEGRLSDPD
jgi:glycine betaine catabolism A